MKKPLEKSGGFFIWNDPLLFFLLGRLLQTYYKFFQFSQSTTSIKFQRYWAGNFKNLCDHFRIIFVISDYVFRIKNCIARAQQTIFE